MHQKLPPTPLLASESFPRIPVGSAPLVHDSLRLCRELFGIVVVVLQQKGESWPSLRQLCLLWKRHSSLNLHLPNTQVYKTGRTYRWNSSGDLWFSI